MPFLTWDDTTMSVHVGVLDDDHKKLVSLINDLFRALQNRQDNKAAAAVIDKLVIHVLEHFTLEECYFNKTEYPDASAHKKEHAEMIKRILAYQKEYKSGNPEAQSVEKASFLWTWLVDHDLTFDKKYGPYLNSKGVY